jgi:hypothetical protein
MLQKQQEKLLSIREIFTQHKEKLEVIESLVGNAAVSLSVHYRESMTKDLANVK